MRIGTILLTFACAVLIFTCLGVETAPTTTQPSTTTPPSTATQPSTTTQPSGLTIRGTVKTSGVWDLQKPDLARVVIYFNSDPALDATTAPRGHATVAQKNKAFVPNFLVIPRGTSVEFPNWDNFDHNVFSFSKAAPAFDLDRYPRGQSKSRTFESVGVIQTFCNIHPEMRAIIFVTPNAYFTHADAEGKFQINNVPPGHYELVAWQERCGEQHQTVDVHQGDMPDTSFTLSENRQSILANDPPADDPSYGIEHGLGVKRNRLNLPVVKDSHPAIDPEE